MIRFLGIGVAPGRALTTDVRRDADPHLMRHRPEFALYCGRVAVGLIAFGIVAVTVHAYIAAEAIVAAVIVAVVTMGSALVTDDGV